jgi:spermidine synthase
VSIFFLFFLSGISGLIYQVLWLRQLSVIFGVTVYAASTVLSAFMAGLAVGGLLANRVLQRPVRPLAAFGVAELLVGLTALASPWLLDALSQLYVNVINAESSSFGVQTFLRFVYAFGVLLVPTAMMGLTLPLLTAATSAFQTEAGRRVSLLYAFNTGGAVVGALAAGFFLIPALGIRASFLLAACVNVLVGGTALWLSSRTAPAQDPSGSYPINQSIGRPEPPHPIGRWAPRTRFARTPVIWAVVAVSGFVSIGLEVIWFRLLLQFVATTTHAFTAMLATVLAGLAIGGLLAAWILARDRDWFAWVASTQAAAGVAAVAAMNALMWTHERGWHTTGIWHVVIIAILPAAVLMGAGFPLALGIATSVREGPESTVQDRDHENASRVGRLYAGNTAGGIIGSLVAGFMLLPLLGSKGALIALATLYVATGLSLWWFARRRALVAGGLALALTALVASVQRMPDPFRVGIERRYGKTVAEIWRREGVQTTASVHANTFQRVLYLDGLHQANDQSGMVGLHRTIGHLPMVLHHAPADVLVIGLGGGATSGAISQHVGTRVDVIELSDSVRQAAALFGHVNYDVLTQPNVHLRIDDGRNFLQVTTRRFDVITADIIQPGHAGAGHVYSREYFSLVRRALREDGVVLQWIGQRPPAEYALIMRTFVSVFPHATLWVDGGLMVGTLRPLRLNPSVFERHRAHPTTRSALDAVGLTDFEALRRLYTAGSDEMRAFVGAGPILTDDRPLVEYGWVPSDQPPLDLSTLKADVALIVVDAGQTP